VMLCSLMLDLSDEFHEFTPIILATRLPKLNRFANAPSAFSAKLLKPVNAQIISIHVLSTRAIFSFKKYIFQIILFSNNVFNLHSNK